MTSRTRHEIARACGYNLRSVPDADFLALRDPWAIPAFLRRADTPAQAAERAEAVKRAPSLNSLVPQPPIAPAAPASRGPRRSRVRLSDRRGRWYYTIRGGYTGGPFDTRELALAAARRAQG